MSLVVKDGSLLHLGGDLFVDDNGIECCCGQECDCCLGELSSSCHGSLVFGPNVICGNGPRGMGHISWTWSCVSGLPYRFQWTIRDTANFGLAISKLINFTTKPTCDAVDGTYGPYSVTAQNCSWLNIMVTIAKTGPGYTFTISGSNNSGGCDCSAWNDSFYVPPVPLPSPVDQDDDEAVILNDSGLWYSAYDPNLEFLSLLN